jgi:hypothetical protein
VELYGRQRRSGVGEVLLNLLLPLYHGQTQRRCLALITPPVPTEVVAIGRLDPGLPVRQVTGEHALHDGPLPNDLVIGACRLVRTAADHAGRWRYVDLVGDVNERSQPLDGPGEGIRLRVVTKHGATVAQVPRYDAPDGSCGVPSPAGMGFRRSAEVWPGATGIAPFTVAWAGVGVSNAATALTLAVEWQSRRSDGSEVVVSDPPGAMWVS